MLDWRGVAEGKAVLVTPPSRETTGPERTDQQEAAPRLKLERPLRREDAQRALSS